MKDSTLPATGNALPAGQAASQLRLLVRSGLLLARERSLDVIVQSALDTGVELCGAAFGAFFYNVFDQDGQRYQLYKLSGATHRDFAAFPLPRPTEIFGQTFVAGSILRSDDITADPRYGKSAPFHGMPHGHPPVRSFLSVPVSSRTGEILGGMFYGHPETAVFSPDCESLIATVAAQAAVAIDNYRLAETLSRQIAAADVARLEHRSTAERLAEVLEATTDAIFLLDRDWRFTFLNRRAVQLIAGDRDLLGQNIWDAFPQAVGTAFYNSYAHVMAGRGPTDFTEFYPPLSSWFYVRAYPTADGIGVFFQDVTRAREAERQRDENARRLRQALEAGEFGTWSWDRASDVIDLDERAASIFGTVPHAPLSRSDLRERCVLPEDLPRIVASFREALTSGGVYNAEYRVRRNGDVRWIAAHGRSTFPAEGSEMIGMTGTVQDITVRKNQEGALRQSEKLAATGRLAATIAHEINNPLEAITNLIYIARSEPTVPAPVQRLLELADDELARVAHIAQQTLGFYRDTTRPGRIDLTRLLHDVCELFDRKLRNKSLTWRHEIDNDLAIFGLPGEIRQVFSNLVVNAIEASKQSEIRLRARRCSMAGREGVSVVVSDRGSGISSSVRDRLFSPFFTTKQSIGTGLGLWVTRGMVEKHGGAIGYRTSTTDPSGTVFRVFLPAKIMNPEVFESPHTNILQ